MATESKYRPDGGAINEHGELTADAGGERAPLCDQVASDVWLAPRREIGDCVVTCLRRTSRWEASKTF